MKIGQTVTVLEGGTSASPGTVTTVHGAETDAPGPKLLTIAIGDGESHRELTSVRHESVAAERETCWTVPATIGHGG